MSTVLRLDPLPLVAVGRRERPLRAILSMYWAAGKADCCRGRFFFFFWEQYLGTQAEVQGLLEDKWMSRAIAINDGCRMAKGQMLKENDISLVKIQMPVIVKPAREDNSNGVTHVKQRKDLQAALDEAFRWDDKILIEKFIPGREIRVAIIP